MSLEEFTAEGIRKLHELSGQLGTVTVTIPSLTEQEKAKKIIEKILPPEEGIVYMPYVREVLFALEYMEKNGLKLKDAKAYKK